MSSTTPTILLAIDPGKVNLGYALLEHHEDGSLKLLTAGADNPSKDGLLYATRFAERLHEVVTPESGRLKFVTIERYVSFQGVNTAESESILMLIGTLCQALLPWTGTDKLVLTRSIDWKMALVKALVKNHGFDNPSISLDKKFSLAAANHILKLEKEITNDHIADATCLAAFPIICPQAVSKRK